MEEVPSLEGFFLRSSVDTRSFDIGQTSEINDALNSMPPDTSPDSKQLVQVLLKAGRLTNQMRRKTSSPFHGF